MNGTARANNGYSLGADKARFRKEMKGRRVFIPTRLLAAVFSAFVVLVCYTVTSFGSVHVDLSGASDIDTEERIVFDITDALRDGRSMTAAER